MLSQDRHAGLEKLQEVVGKGGEGNCALSTGQQCLCNLQVENCQNGMCFGHEIYFRQCKINCVVCDSAIAYVGGHSKQLNAAVHDPYSPGSKSEKIDRATRKS